MTLTLFSCLLHLFMSGSICTYSQVDPAYLTRVTEWKLQSVKKTDKNGNGTANAATSDTRYRFYKDGTLLYTIHEGATVTEEYGSWTLEEGSRLIISFSRNPALIRSYTIDVLNEKELVFVKNKGNVGETTFYLSPAN